MAEISIGKADLKPGSSKCLSAADRQLSLANIKGKYYCIDNLCTHAEGPLCEGEIGTVDDYSVTCPWHGSVFDYRDGKVLNGPARKEVRAYKVTERDGELFIEI
ncbi:MAG TPA: Rieske (2Fe-2S) protein [Candidatus Bilamarchaeum sp.]|nr:Rieske (2Fe-2S) protein [Candidatus Bilamarchaeum sp.]